MPSLHLNRRITKRKTEIYHKDEPGLLTIPWCTSTLRAAHLEVEALLRLFACRADRVLGILPHLTESVGQLTLVLSTDGPIHLLNGDVRTTAGFVELL